MRHSLAQVNLEMANRFRRWLDAQRYMPSTVASYYRKAARLCIHIGDKPLRKVTPLDIADFLAREKQPSWSGGFVSDWLIGLRRFFDFLYFGGIVDRVAPRFLKARPRMRKLPTVLTKNQVRSLISAAKNPRDRALIETYYATGCRTAELTTVRVENINFHRRTFKVGAKRKERIVYFGSAAAKAIKRYLGPRRDGFLFQDIIPFQRGFITHNRHAWMGVWRDFRPAVEVRGRRHTEYLGSYKKISYEKAKERFNRLLKGIDLSRPKGEKPLAKSTMTKIVQKAARRAGLQMVTPRMLRHCFGTHMVEGGADLPALQALMGHSYLSSTQVYVHISNQAVSKNFRKAHPRGR